MKIQLLLFASLREQCGRSTVECDLPDAARVHTVLDQLFTDATVSQQWRDCLMFAVNNCFVTPETVLHDGDIVVLIPPVAGG